MKNNMKKLTTRQWRLYELLVATAEWKSDYWVSKIDIAYYVNANCEDTYNISCDDRTHDICSTINLDRLAINNSLEVDKIILIKDNMLKIATEEEAIELEQELHNQAMKLLGRMSFIQEKRRRNNQGKVLSNQLNPIDENSMAKEFHETFVGE